MDKKVLGTGGLINPPQAFSTITYICSVANIADVRDIKILLKSVKNILALFQCNFGLNFFKNPIIRLFLTPQ